MYSVAVRRFGKRMGGVLRRGIGKETIAKRKEIRVQRGNVGKSLFESNP